MSAPTRNGLQKALAAEDADAASRTGRLWSGGWTTSTPPRRPSVSWAGCGARRGLLGRGRGGRPQGRRGPQQGPRRPRTRGPRAWPGSVWPTPCVVRWPPGRLAAARQALTLLQPNGHLNDRIQAKREIAAACVGLPGRPWKKVRAFLTDRRTLTFLDRAQRQVAVAEPRGSACGLGAAVGAGAGRRGLPALAALRRRGLPGSGGGAARVLASWRRTGPSRTVVYGGCWRGWCVPPARWSA